MTQLRKQKLEAAASSGAVQALKMENDAPVVGQDAPTADFKMGQTGRLETPIHSGWPVSDYLSGIWASGICKRLATTADLSTTSVVLSRSPTLRPESFLQSSNSSWLVMGGRAVVRIRPCRPMGASANRVRYMDELTEDAAGEIGQIHSSWIKFEVAGQDHSLMSLCADDIESWPPDAQPMLGRAAVSTRLAHATTRIHGIEITDHRIRGSNEVAYLTASYKTSFSSAEDSTPRQAVGNHLWIMEKRAVKWVVVLVSWSVWDGAVIPESRQPAPSANAPILTEALSRFGNSLQRIFLRSSRVRPPGNLELDRIRVNYFIYHFLNMRSLWRA